MERLGYDSAARILDSLRASVAFLTVDDNNRYRIHDLFLGFLHHEQLAAGKSLHSRKQFIAASALESGGFIEDALAIFISNDNYDDIIRILKAFGESLIDGGAYRMVEASLRVIRKSDIERDAVLLYLMALLKNESSEGADTCIRALKTGSGNRLLLAKIGALLVGSCISSQDGVLEAIELLASLDLYNDSDTEVRALTVSSFATALVFLGRYEEGLKSVADCEDILRSLSTSTQITVTNRIGVALYYFGDLDRAFAMAERALTLSYNDRSPVLRYRGAILSVLYAISIRSGKPLAALEYSREITLTATRRGDGAMYRLGMTSELDCLTRLGKTDDVSDKITKLVQEFGPEIQNDKFTVIEALAFQSAWNGDFNGAAALLSRGLDIVDLFQVVQRHSLIAVWLAGAQRTRESIAAIDAYRVLSKSVRMPVDHFTQCGAAFAQLACAMTGYALLEEDVAITDPVARQIQSIAQLTSGFGRVPSSVLHQHLSKLRAIDYDGYARFVERLSLTDAGSLNAGPNLTPTEIAILGDLNRGIRPKAIAYASGRSVFTIQNHIRSAITKLNASGRDEALIEARRRGILASTTP